MSLMALSSKGCRPWTMAFVISGASRMKGEDRHWILDLIPSLRLTFTGKNLAQDSPSEWRRQGSQTKRDLNERAQHSDGCRCNMFRFSRG